MHWSFSNGLFSFLTLLAITPLVTAESADQGKLDFFEKKVRPLLVDNCYNCHSANTNSKGGLRVDDRNGLLAGGDGGPAVVPGEPEKSRLIQAVRHTNAKLQMPPKKKLAPEDIAILEQWILDGAAWPQVRVPLSIGRARPEYEELRKEHWAWQPLAQVKVPVVRDQSWSRDDVDRFILAALEEKQVKPSRDADKMSLIRRVTFDLTGLPPTLEEADAFLADASADAFAKVVDRLLASPAFGERWGRHWLDVARYGESTGSSRNVPYPQAWRYRDYVIDSFNRDKPYDQFIREQVAGDLLPASSPQQRDEQLIATGFLALGVKDVNQRFKVRFVMDNIDEQIDTLSGAFLALTVSCARCHDHKFDPIPITEYYALAGIFHSSDLAAGVRNKMGGGGLDYYDTAALIRLTDVPQRDPAEEARIESLKKEVQQAQQAWDKIRGTPEGLAKGPGGVPHQQQFRLKLEKLQAELNALSNISLRHVALGVRDSKKISDTEVRIRGEAEKLGPVVERGFLSLVHVPDAPKVNPAQSGRLELAHWLSSPANPLTSRVIVNRIWHHLYGQGLVTSVDNFGITGDAPSHPELLDHLAARFVRESWSIKKMVRLIVLSRSYQLSSEATQEQLTVDPANRLVWRHSPRRLTAEELRDAALVAAGSLNPTPPTASPAGNMQVREIPNNGPDARKLAELAQSSNHRSVYLPLLRGLTPTSLEVFDFAEQGMVTGSRNTTTVATQALYLLNDPFVLKQSKALATRLLSRSDLNDRQRVLMAYRLTFGRNPSDAEIARAVSYVQSVEQSTANPLVAAGPSNSVQPPVKGKATDKGKGKENNKTKGDPDQPVTASSTKPVDASAPPPEEPPIDPDQIIQVDAPIKEVAIDPGSPKVAAWSSFCQALLGSGEFLYLK